LTDPRHPDPTAWAHATLGLEFADPALLLRALTHRSHAAESYERLEFLGDRVLGLAVATWLYELYPNDPEGKLNQRYARLVSRETCARVARRLGIAPWLRLGQQARTDGAANSDNILGDVMEALIGAVYLAHGIKAAHTLVRTHWQAEMGELAEAPKHPKSAVQEWAAARSLKAPVYRLLGRSGPHHNPRFRVELSVAELAPVEAEGTSKQEAETAAAEAFLAAQRGAVDG
jgi:ribonuclease-3